MAPNNRRTNANNVTPSPTAAAATTAAAAATAAATAAVAPAATGTADTAGTTATESPVGAPSPVGVINDTVTELIDARMAPFSAALESMQQQLAAQAQMFTQMQQHAAAQQQQATTQQQILTQLATKLAAADTTVEAQEEPAPPDHAAHSSAVADIVRATEIEAEEKKRQATTVEMQHPGNQSNFVSYKCQEFRLVCLSEVSKQAAALTADMPPDQALQIMREVSAYTEARLDRAAEEAKFQASIAVKSEIYGPKFAAFAKTSLISNYNGDYDFSTEALADAAKACKQTPHAPDDYRPYDRQPYDRQPYRNRSENRAYQFKMRGKGAAAPPPQAEPRSRSRSR